MFSGSAVHLSLTSAPTMLSSVLSYFLLHVSLCLGAPSVLGGRPSAFDVRSEKRAPHVDPFNNLVVFDPPSDYIVPRTLYARTMLHSDQQTIYATWENYSPEGGNNPLVYFPIYKSTDLGKTWEHISNVTDQGECGLFVLEGGGG